MSGKGRANRRPDAGALGLLVEILRDSENLRGAKCVDYRDEFDPDVPAADLGYADEAERWDMCNTVCRACPVRGECWAWASGLTVHRAPLGPTAATQINPFRMGRPRRSRPALAALLAPTEPEPMPEVPEGQEPEISRPGPTQRRGARSRVRPSIHRNNRSRHRRTR